MYERQKIGGYHHFQKGLVLVDKLDQFNDQIDAVLKGVDEKEAQTINQLLDKIRATSESKI